jgi:signal transduction histidine kinase
VNKHSLEPAQLSREQLSELRRVCERLAYIGGGSLPPDMNEPEQVISTLSSLVEICGKRVNRGRRNQEQEDHGELEDVERLKARFIRNISHELRTPLACIDGFARALLQMEHAAGKSSDSLARVTESREQFLSIISQEAQRLGQLIEDVLDLTEIESNRRRPEPSLFTAKSIFDSAVESLNTNQKFTNISMRLKPEDTGPNIFADRETMIEVLRQLLANAQKFSGGQDIVLGAEYVSIGPDRNTQASDSGMQDRVTTATQLYVKDKGIGIPKEELNHIFAKFYRSERVALSFPGTGLGLSIVRALVAQNGGQVWADSEAGRGSTFYLLLPNQPPGA